MQHRHKCYEKPGSMYHFRTKSQWQLSSMAGLMYQFLLRQDGSLSFLFLTPSFGEFFELDAWEMELDTETLLAMIHPEDIDDFHNSIAIAACNLQSWKWAGRFILSSGQTKWIQWDAQPSRQANGNIFWNGLLVDVTSHYQLESEVERLSFLLGLTERLQTSTDLNEIAEFAIQHLVETTNSTYGEVKVINSIDESSHACPVGNDLSAELAVAYRQPQEIEQEINYDLLNSEGMLWQVVKTGEPIFVKDYASNPNSVATFGQPEINRIGIFPISATDGNVIGVLTLNSHNFPPIKNSPQQDLILAACRILGVRIERTKAQERLLKANKELELTSQKLTQKALQLEEALDELKQTQTQLVETGRMSSLGSLVAGIAHEINNPVSFIYGNLPHASKYFIDVLTLMEVYQQSYPHPAPEIEEAIEDIDLNFIKEDLPRLLVSMQAGAERIRNIVYSLRNFARLDEADIKAIDLHESIDNILMILDSRLKKYGSRVEIHAIKEYGKLPLVECYAGQLNQVLMYIIMNAIDALEEGNSGKITKENFSTPTIRISTELSNSNTVLIRIADNGPGIPLALQPRLFDPFFTTKSVGQGTGLGLSISHSIITQKHGGKLKCISTPGEGAEFIIEIPLLVAKAV
ncbi:ATP-binding protein [Phormidium nigroviride]